MAASLLRRNILELTVFVCGAVVMIFEIIGSRVVSPYIGTSTYVWTSLIGVILGSLSLGYWLGGRMADRSPHLRVLAFVVLIAGGLISLTILVKDLVLSVVSAAPAGLEIRSMMAAILLFAPASVALGFVTPYTVKLKMSSLDDSGKTVGRLYALSTIGSIVGTFAAGFFLIPFVGSTRTLYLIAASLIVLGIVLVPFSLKQSISIVIVLFVFGVVSQELTAYYMYRTVALHDIDTEYARVRVFAGKDGRTGRPIRAMATDPYFVQSLIYLDGDDLAARYTHFYHLIRYYRPEFKRTLMIGGAGYTFPRNYLETYPNAAIDVVEIDPGMTASARRHFKLADDPRLRIIHEDGRVFLNRVPAGSYNVVLMDAFGSLFSVPHHLTTVEAVRNISRSLDEEGIVIFNAGSSIRGDTSRFLQAALTTYRDVFTDVLVFKVNENAADEDVQNLIIVACKSKCREEDTDDPEITRLLTHRYTTNIPTEVPILTDDLAPVEYYNSFGQNLGGR